MEVWLVGVGYVVVLEHTLVPILFSPVHPYIFLKFFNGLVYFFMAFGHFKLFNLLPPASTLILTYSLYLVFHLRHTTKNQRGKPPA